jgi:hypothetical protein
MVEDEEGVGIGGGMTRMESWRPRYDGGSTEDITTLKVGSRWRHEIGTRVDSRLARHKNNCKS